jgi:hypothetical protein
VTAKGHSDQRSLTYQRGQRPAGASEPAVRVPLRAAPHLGGDTPGECDTRLRAVLAALRGTRLRALVRFGTSLDSTLAPVLAFGVLLGFDSCAGTGLWRAPWIRLLLRYWPLGFSLDSTPAPALAFGVLLGFDSCSGAFDSLVGGAPWRPAAWLLVHENDPLARSSNNTDAREQPARPGHPTPLMYESDPLARSSNTTDASERCLRARHGGQFPRESETSRPVTTREGRNVASSVLGAVRKLGRDHHASGRRGVAAERELCVQLAPRIRL